jgi:hypothetical protein
VKAVHIGFPKTATTFLQTVVFPQLAEQGFTYSGKAASARFFGSLIDDDDTIFDEATLRERLQRSAEGGEHVLLSYEGLTGHHYRSGFVNRSQIARRLQRIGFDRVLITIRNQFDALEAAYKQYVKSGGVLPFCDYVTFDSAKSVYLHPRYFDYALVYELYAETFGRDNVLILQYERLPEPSFLVALCEFLSARPVTVELGVRVNGSLSYEKTRFLRACNHFTYSSFRPSTLLPKGLSTTFVHGVLSRVPFGNSNRSFVDGGARGSIEASFAESNRQLARAAGITLTEAYPGSLCNAS